MRKIYGYARHCTTLSAVQIATLSQMLSDEGAEEIVMDSMDSISADTPNLDQLLESAAPGSAIICPAIHHLCISTQKLREIATIVQSRQLCLFIPDKLLVDFRTGEGDAMSQAFIHALNLIGELEHTVNSKQIRAGLAKARQEGRALGRPRTTPEDIPQVFIDHLDAYDAGKLNVSTLARECELSRPTVYKYLRMLKRSPKHSGNP